MSFSLDNSTSTNPIICDGCNVHGVWEHRCHGDRARVRDEPTGKPCECRECHDDIDCEPRTPTGTAPGGTK
jgi:hypothetical protein